MRAPPAAARKAAPLCDKTGSHGWEASAAWKDITFSAKQIADIERLAMVGEKQWQPAWRRSASRLQRRRCATSITPTPPRHGSAWLNRSEGTCEP
ncbi:MAG: STAS/SEC14 domain-containing protein [Immundisolibacter sp.]|uniref:STAS/SEC14 domain-containing protein n=1 Tax=Immundisolibacter sp. TaxID=1934948 RepID=UPI003EE2087E